MTNFALIAGARLGSWAWDDVVPHLRAAGHGVHPLTLSNIAEKQDVPAGQQTHVQDIVDEVERQDLREVVLVGHSYSGIPSGQAAGRIGGRPAHAVFLDSGVPADGEPFVAAWPDGEAMVRASIRRQLQHRRPALAPTGAHFFNLVPDPLVNRRLGRTLHEDTRRMEALICQTDLTGPSTVPPVLLDHPTVTAYRTAETSAAGVFTARADLAASMLHELKRRRYVRTAMGITTACIRAFITKLISNDGVKKK